MAAIAISFITTLGLQRPTQGPATARSQLALSRRCALGVATLPLLGLAPFSSLAYESKYLPPGEESEEFKSLDARATEFRRKQLAYKKTWEELTATFVAAPDDDAAFAALGDLQKAFVVNRSLPESVRRDDFLKTIRRKQRAMEEAGKWAKPVRMRVLELKTAIDASTRPKGMTDGPVFG